MAARPPQLDVLFEDNHLLVVNKPAGLATQGAAADVVSVVDLAKEYIARKYNKSGNVYLGVVSRLDSPTTGVLVLARTSKAAARLSAAFRTRDVRKHYVALVEGTIAPSTRTIKSSLVKDESQKRMRSVSSGTRDSQVAVLSYRTLGSQANSSLLLVELETGRKHQIRVQLAAEGHPVVGDRKYDGKRPFAPGIALHALRLELPHPIGAGRHTFAAPLPASWPAWCAPLVG